MSFIVNDQKKELNFNMNRVNSVGPDIGPGKYIPLYPPAPLKKARAPFQTGALRKLDPNFTELLHQALRFRMLDQKEEFKKGGGGSNT